MKVIYGLKYDEDLVLGEEENALVYSLIKDGEEHDLFTEVINKYEKRYSQQIKFALLRLKRMVNKRGIQLDEFENESEDGTLPIYKLNQTGKLRLYFIVVDQITIICGGGEEKLVVKWQDDPKLRKIVERLKKIIIEIDENDIKITKENFSRIFFEIDE